MGFDELGVNYVLDEIVRCYGITWLSFFGVLVDKGYLGPIMRNVLNSKACNV